MAATKRMDQVLHILNTYRHHRSIKATVRATGCARNTVRTYLGLAAVYDPDLNVVLALPPEQLRQVFYPANRSDDFDRAADFELHLEDWIKELDRTGVTRFLLWEEYRRRVKDGFGYTRFCNLLRERMSRRKLTLPLEHDPGRVIQFDYAGKTLDISCPETGQVRAHQVLVAVLPFSQLTFATIVDSQRVTDFIHGIVQALNFFGGAPKAIVSDNLKAFVTKPHRYEPEFNDAVRQLAAHYRVDLVAARPYKPKDKAAVEGGVKTVYQQLFAPLRDRVFTSTRSANVALLERLTLLNERPFQKRTGSRQSTFDEHERPLLAPLPSTPFSIKTTVKAKVSLSYHVYLGQRGNYYSVPFQYVGKTAEVVYDENLVEVFVGTRRVALHERCHPVDRGRYVTELGHMPRSHREWKSARGFDRDYFLKKARAIGPALEWAMTLVLATRYHESHTYGTCQGVLRLAERYGHERLEAASVYLRPSGVAGYRRLKNVLDNQLDRVARPPDLFNSIDHDNLRGAGAFK